MKDVSDIDLQFIEFARYIENALSQKGYTRVKSKEKADQLIRLAYGIGAPPQQVRRPIQHQPGIVIRSAICGLLCLLEPKR